MATSLMNFLRTFGGAAAGALCDTVYSTTFVNNIDKDTALQSRAIIEELSNYDLKLIIKRTDLMNSMSPAAKLLIKHELMKGIRNTFRMHLGFAAIAIIASAFVTNQRLPKETKPKDDQTAEPIKDEDEDKRGADPVKSENESDESTPSSQVKNTE